MATAMVQPAKAGLWVDFGSTGRPADWYRALQAGNTGGLGPVVGVILDCMTGGWAQDYQAALDAGLEVMLFQGYYVPAWTTGGVPQGAIQRAQQAIQAARQAGYLTGGIIWLDSEKWPPTVSVDYWAAWINAWSDTIRQAGYVDGIYVGAGQPPGVTAADLYERLITQHYWKSASAVPDVATRGYQIVQTRLDLAVAGYGVDLDTVHPDHLGALPPAVWAGSATPSAAPSAPTPTDLSTQLASLAQRVTTLEALVGRIRTWVHDGGSV